MASSSQVSFPSPQPFPWDSADQTIRLVTSSTPTPQSDNESILDYFNKSGRRFSYGLQPSDFESLDSITIPSVANHADDERSSGDDRSLASCGHGDPADEVPSLTRSGITIDQKSIVSDVGKDLVKENDGNSIEEANRTINAVVRVRDELIKTVDASPIFANTLERKQFIALLSEPISAFESVNSGSTESLSVLGFLNSNPCPAESSVGQSVSGSSQTQLTDRSSSGRAGDTSLTDETSIESHPVVPRVPVAWNKIDCPPAMEFGSLADWGPRFRLDEWVPRQLAQAEEQQRKKKKGFFKRARNLLRRLRWRK